ncbi:MAG: hypothetical protein HDS71_04815 [Bacteroidales bacterium]|nr:hypothetical protein [Bacteroidales bacterium]
MAPIFSKLEGNPYIMSGADAPHTVLNRAGVIVKEELDKLESFRRDKIRIIKSVIMPDHLHFVVRVLNELQKPVTVYVGLTMSACTRRLRDEGILSEDSSCFNSGISDRIVYKSGQLDVLYKYVTDNPRRLMIKRMLPQLFRRNLGIRIGEMSLDAIGNIFLLRKSLKAVHVRRKWNEDEVNEYKRECIEGSTQGEVLISPFIHPVEKEIMRLALDKGGSVVRIRDRGFGERWKPSGKEFDICAEGRMLFIAETGTALHKTEMHYGKASHLNDIAEWLAATPGLFMSISKR